MIDLSRRDIFKTIVKVGLLCPLYNQLPSLNQIEPTSLVKLETLEELRFIYKGWFLNNSIQPAEYINSLSEKTFKTPEALKAQIQQDFIKNHVIEISGLILSKTEVAISSHYYELIVNHKKGS